MTDITHPPRARPGTLARGAALPSVLPDLITEDTYDHVRDAYLRAAQVAEPDPHGSLLRLRWLVIKDTQRGCLRTVPIQIAEACRLVVLQDILNGTREPLLPRVEARLKLQLSSQGRRPTPETDTPSTLSPGLSDGLGLLAPGADVEETPSYGVG